jgi:hypothetical protein
VSDRTDERGLREPTGDEEIVAGRMDSHRDDQEDRARDQSLAPFAFVVHASHRSGGSRCRQQIISLETAIPNRRRADVP